MTDTFDKKAFRAEMAAWLEANCPESQRQPINQAEQIWGGRRRRFPSADAQAWFEVARDRGFTAPEWPEQYGGAGFSSEQAKILRQEMKRLGCRPPLYELGIWMLGPALLVYGNETQKQRHLRAICRGEVRWAQGYSEPGSGSDLASLRTKAEDKGDHFLVNGTKIWTTKADECDWIFCLVRTDEEAPKQQGISFLLIDMATEGVSTTPIPLINGDSEFCQTFFDNVRVPKENLVGELNKGWSVAKELLKHERKMMSNTDDMIEQLDFDLVESAKAKFGTDSDGALQSAELRARMAQHLMRDRAVKQLGERVFWQTKAGQLDQRLPLLLKHLGTSEVQVADELVLEVLGKAGLRMADTQGESDNVKLTKRWAFNKALTIAGGTSEIQLNIIAKRALGLPSGEGAA